MSGAQIANIAYLSCHLHELDRSFTPGSEDPREIERALTGRSFARLRPFTWEEAEGLVKRLRSNIDAMQKEDCLG